MKTEQILMCVVSLILGMLLFHMLKGVCGCKVMEGQPDETDRYDQFLEKMGDHIVNEEMIDYYKNLMQLSDFDKLIKYTHKINRENLNKSFDGYPNKNLMNRIQNHLKKTIPPEEEFVDKNLEGMLVEGQVTDCHATEREVGGALLGVLLGCAPTIAAGADAPFAITGCVGFGVLGAAGGASTCR